jgi:acetolactate synthase small subunit
MKGITQYIIILLVTVGIVVLSFFLIAELLSKEEEVSVISRKLSSVVNKFEYSRIYLIKMIENEYSLLKSNLSPEEIADKLNKKYSFEIGDTLSNFEIVDIDVKEEKIYLKVSQKSTYSDSTFVIEASDIFTINIG